MNRMQHRLLKTHHLARGKPHARGGRCRERRRRLRRLRAASLHRAGAPILPSLLDLHLPAPGLLPSLEAQSLGLLGELGMLGDLGPRYVGLPTMVLLLLHVLALLGHRIPEPPTRVLELLPQEVSLEGQALEFALQHAQAPLALQQLDAGVLQDFVVVLVVRLHSLLVLVDHTRVGRPRLLVPAVEVMSLVRQLLSQGEDAAVGVV
mmetsp:Transcript_103511/g.333510  ORF Transcript_103511/g.333510 Transcript_103511/m.333510 type:complete len:206 (+) Transcript_103511:2-619(+)